MDFKKQKTTLLVTSILGLIISIFYIISLISGSIVLETVDELSNISLNDQIAILGICGVSNLISIFLVVKDILKHKKTLIFLNILQFLLGSIFNILFAIINFIALAKVKNPDEIREKKQLPLLEDITKYKWYIYFIIFVFLFIICYTPALDILPIPQTKIAAIITMVILYIIQVSLLIIPMWNELKRDFVVFKDNFKLYLSRTLPRFGLILIAYFIFNFTLTVLAGTIPTNQAIINEWPLYISAFLAIIIAPLTEELMFRGFLKKFIKNNFLFVIASSLIFGGLHVIQADSLQQFLFIIPYSILGFAFSLNYVKTKNIVSNIVLHSMWNSLAVLAMIFLRLLV